MRGWWLFGRAGLKPAPTGWMDGQGWVLLWSRGPVPPRALTLSRRAGEGMIVVDEGVAAVMGWWWFSRAGLKPAPTSGTFAWIDGIGYWRVGVMR